VIIELFVVVGFQIVSQYMISIKMVISPEKKCINC